MSLPPRSILLALTAAWSGAHAAPAPAAPVADEALVPYTVTSKDTLIGLNKTLFTTPGAWKDIARINHLTDSNRIKPGQVLLVPVRHLQSKDVPARLDSAFGDVRINDKPAAAGALFNVGDTLRTGPSSSAVVLLADGSHVKLSPSTEGRLDEQRRIRMRATAAAVDDGLIAASLRLVSGSIEVFASKVLRARPLEVSTPTAVIGVRGTTYRVRNDVTPATAAASAVNTSATEVMEGKVHAQVGTEAAQAADVPANFGATLEPGRKPQVLPLPPAPDLTRLPTLFDRLPLHLTAGNLALRVQIAEDAAFDHIVLDRHIDARGDLRVPGLADGHWHLRARSISAEGLEGADSVREFELRAHPEAPFPVDPPDNAKRAVGDVTLRWTQSPDAAHYVVEVARDARFEGVALRDEDVHGEQLVFHPATTAFGAADGLYWWHVVSVDAKGRRGAWTDAQALVLRAVPRAPIGQLSPDGAAIELLWGGRQEDRVEVQLARDASYQQVVARADFSAPSGRLARPAPGIYYAHYRYVEPDGFRTAWSGDVKIDVDANWRADLRALVPDAPQK